ncbi:alpha/beta fold hydrolase [Tamaricihabitans halophyticus]|uniref:alpha/beta fold hydrolase n=1 Tax=Tamaricihabitans halophyticus TaxID=1262583 RepID=UPI001FB450F9|nr:alpha/beta hydrolase [Tamaricihabitans halophyticus]
MRSGTSGTPVLLLHGIGGSSASFHEQLGPLAREHQVFAWDAPGYGASADPTTAPGMAGYAEIAAELLADVGRAHVVGVSWGGVIATRLAAEYPELLRSLTLASSTRGSGRSEQAATGMRARASELADLGAAGFARARGPRLPAPTADPRLVESIVATMAKVRLPGYLFAAESMAETDHTERLAEVTVPTLVLVGALDEITGLAESRQLASAIPGARLRVLPGVGHAANQEWPVEFNRVVLDFMSKVDESDQCQGGT